MHHALDSLTPRGLAIGAAIFAGFVIVLFLASLVVPGKTAHGPKLADGTTPSYRLNGFPLFLFVTGATAALVLLCPGALGVVHAHFWPIFAVANVFAFAVTIHLARAGRRAAERAGEPAKPGVVAFVVDCFYGVETSPRLLGVDLKLFSYRPSLMGLGLLNLSFAVAQWQAYGEISGRMWLYQIFYFAYLLNYFQFEYGMVYTWDLIAERFGWMLIWGDYVLVPFFYSIPGWYLVDNRDPLPTWQIAAFTALYVIGFTLFRGSNEQKHSFKADPRAKIWFRTPEAIGGKLLVSGFWGVGRKLNYTGELCMYYAWALCAGTHSIVPFLLPLWLTGFFPHRAWRDEQRCKAKYGPLWDEYCKRARFRMIPFIY